MKTDKEVNIFNHVVTKAQDLSNKRERWENGTFKKSNDELYALLSDCLDFYEELRGKKTRCKALNDFLKDNSIKFNEGSSLETRIVRAVFNSSFQKRAYGYARVIKVASEEKKQSETMSDFITSRGGIEEIRRTNRKGETPAELRKQNIRYAKELFEQRKPLVQLISNSASQLEFDEGAEHNLFVGLMRLEDNGQYSLVYETSAPSVVNSALAQAGKDENAAEKISEQVEQERQRAFDSASAVAHASKIAKAA